MYIPYKIPRFATPLGAGGPRYTFQDAPGYPERIARKTSLEFNVAPFFTGAAIFGGSKDSMRNGPMRASLSPCLPSALTSL